MCCECSLVTMKIADFNRMSLKEAYADEREQSVNLPEASQRVQDHKLIVNQVPTEENLELHNSAGIIA